MPRALLVTVLAGLFGAPAFAQTDVPLLPVPGLGAFASPQITQVSETGARAFIVSRGWLAPPYALVLETRTGQVVFDSRDVASPERQYERGRLTPDGASLVYPAIVQAGAAVALRVRDLSTGADRLVATGTPLLALKDVSRHGEVLVYVDRVGDRMGVAVQGPSLPRRWLENPCGTSVPAPEIDLSLDGRRLVFATPASSGERLALAMVDTSAGGASRCLDLPDGIDLSPDHRPHLAGDGTVVGLTVVSHTGVTATTTVRLLTWATGAVRPLPLAEHREMRLESISDEGRYVLLRSVQGNGCCREDRVTLHDAVSGLATSVGQISIDYHPGGGYLAGDGTAAFVCSYLSGVTNPIFSNRVAWLDVDGDGLHDAWETTYGLDPSDGANAAADPDGDGRTSAQEYAEASHPRATPSHYFAEGATGAFFASSVALFNPSDTPTVANLRFLGADGVTVALPVAVSARQPAYMDADSLAGALPEFSLTVESLVPLAVERRMTWDRERGYGGHVSSGVAAPAQDWHFAEGATIAGLQTFFLIGNPGDVMGTLTLRYMLTTGVTVERRHEIGARARITVWVNREGAPLDAAEFATSVTSDVPIVVERAVYLDVPGQPFGAGSVSAGVPAPQRSWWFAEAATGASFDTYLLLANPGDAPVVVNVAYRRSVATGASEPPPTIARVHTLPAHSRRSVRVADESPDLTAAEVAINLTGSGPFVAERAMWWPGTSSSTWRGTHAEAGAASPGALWVAPEVLTDEDAGGWESFLLISAPASAGPRLRVTLFCHRGGESTMETTLAAARTTLWLRTLFPDRLGHRCAALVESLPLDADDIGRVPIVVEKAMYRGAFEAGAASLATRLPEPP